MDTPTPQKSIGTIEGKDCSWHVLGYSRGAPDVRHGNPKDNERIRTRYAFGRMALHAHRLSLLWNGGKITFLSPMPPEFGVLLPETAPV